MAGDNSFKTYHHAKRLALILVTAALGFFTQVNAQPVDPLLDEGVQILIEKHEIVHLQKIGQLDPAKAQERLQANKQRWNTLSQKVGQWPKEKQRAFTEELKKRTAAAKVPLDQKWAAEARQLQKDGSAQTGQESASTATPAQADSGGARPVGQSQSGPDVLGIRIGMSIDEALAALKTINPEFRIKISRFGGSPEVGPLANPNDPPTAITAEEKDSLSLSSYGKYTGRQTIHILLTPPPEPPAVLAMRRQFFVNPDEPMSTAQVLDTLRTKYGKELAVNPSIAAGGSSVWFFDENHKPVPPPKVNTDGYCYQEDKQFAGVGNANTKIDERVRKSKLSMESVIKEMRGIDPKCGTIIFVHYATMNNPEFLSGFTTTLFDHAVYYQAAVRAYTYVRDQQNARDKQELEKAKQKGAPGM